MGCAWSKKTLTSLHAASTEGEDRDTRIGYTEEETNSETNT